MPLSCLMWTRTGGPDSPASREQSSHEALAPDGDVCVSGQGACAARRPVIAPITRTGASAK